MRLRDALVHHVALLRPSPSAQDREATGVFLHLLASRFPVCFRRPRPLHFQQTGSRLFRHLQALHRAIKIKLLNFQPQGAINI